MLPSSRRMPCLRARFSGEPAIGPDMRRALGAGASERLARVTGRGFRPSGLRSAAFSPAAWSGAHWRQVRRGSLPAATVAQGGPYLDDPSRDERPANYDSNRERLDVAARHEPGIISGKGQCCGHHPHDDPKKKEDRSQDSLANSSTMSRGHRRSSKAT